MYNLYCEVDVTSNPSVQCTVNSTYYNDTWDNLTANYPLVFDTRLSFAPNPKPTLCILDSNATGITVIVDSAEKSTFEFGGSRPPTW